ncbi:hypothetical protein CBG25_04095 [Arsenophonus sp. ENCA]|uniref:IS66 family insertion sequence element accessory protein TnpB n=1 Tax=Arsenophonus sp. ENCA TaxID=1987579 RepID=UPI000BC46E85|nr:IS66 family insertion sequence element accessory protein TnpB [Arsenophonus sp. ENCA]PAV08379.1 hypothetical protein CBG25_04095 [Arsenophonus sp. ENCA]
MKMFVEVPAIYLYSGHVDFRKSINGLLLIIEQDMAHSPFDEALFVFCNRHGPFPVETQQTHKTLCSH